MVLFESHPALNSQMGTVKTTQKLIRTQNVSALDEYLIMFYTECKNISKCGDAVVPLRSILSRHSWYHI